MTTWAKINKSAVTGTIAELWSSSYLPWDVSNQPWLDENTVASNAWNNINKS